MRAAAWIGPAAAIAGLGALFAVAVVPAWGHRPGGAGIFYTLLRFDHSLPLTGLGLAFAQAKRREFSANLMVVAAGIGLGAMIAGRLADTIEADFTVAAYLFLIGPCLCLVMGATLIAPVAFRIWMLPPAALFAGAVLGLAIAIDNPSQADVEFAAASVLTGGWLILVPALFLRPINTRGLRIGGRIFGSWLVAIGLMLAGLELARLQGTGESAIAGVTQRLTLLQIGDVGRSHIGPM